MQSARALVDERSCLCKEAPAEPAYADVRAICSWNVESLTSYITRLADRRVDWSVRDKQIAARIAKVAEEWRNSSGKPRRVTVTAVCQELGIFAVVSKNIRKLPLTRAVLDEVTETILQFVMRRIAFAVQQFVSTGEIPTSSNLGRAAGINYTRNIDGVETALRDTLREIETSIESRPLNPSAAKS
jgi:hypothetical protein